MRTAEVDVENKADDVAPLRPLEETRAGDRDSTSDVSDVSEVMSAYSMTLPVVYNLPAAARLRTIVGEQTYTHIFLDGWICQITYNGYSNGAYGTCQTCGIMAKVQRCARCKLALYCSRTCQHAAQEDLERLGSIQAPTQGNARAALQRFAGIMPTIVGTGHLGKACLVHLDAVETMHHVLAFGDEQDWDMNRDQCKL
jgi:hypothetical protein